jgi:hypothetical protein
MYIKSIWAIIWPLYRHTKIYTEILCTIRLEMFPFYIKNIL